MYFYIKAIHIIFVVTWFAGLFYMPRLFVYIAEAEDKPEPERSAVLNQLKIMSRRLWFGITWPSAILTLIFGGWMWWLYPATPSWLWIKIGFVVGLYAYHLSLHHIQRKQEAGTSRYTGQQMRLWNEVATVFLVAVVMLVVVKENISLAWGIGGLLVFIALLMGAISAYKAIRSKSK